MNTAVKERPTRVALRWSRNQLAYVVNASDRAIMNWEKGDPISPVYAAKLREIQSVYNDSSN
jgi:DNA-binding XRE family transcriptional regulator